MKAIAAVDSGWSIGRGGKLLVSIPADKEHFKAKTMGKAVIMGRKTFESLPGKKPLRGRYNIVLTRDPDYRADGAVIAHSPAEAAEAAASAGYADEDTVVIGGGEIYRLMLPYTDTAYITKIEYVYDADTTFPDLDKDPEWELAAAGEEQTYFDLVYEFDVYRRVKR